MVSTQNRLKSHLFRGVELDCQIERKFMRFGVHDRALAHFTYCINTWLINYNVNTTTTSSNILYCLLYETTKRRYFFARQKQTNENKHYNRMGAYLSCTGECVILIFYLVHYYIHVIEFSFNWLTLNYKNMVFDWKLYACGA